MRTFNCTLVSVNLRDFMLMSLHGSLAGFYPRMCVCPCMTTFTVQLSWMVHSHRPIPRQRLIKWVQIPMECGRVGMCQCSMNTSTQFLATHLILCQIIQICETTKSTVLSIRMHYCLFRFLSVSVSCCVDTITVKRIKHCVNHCGIWILMYVQENLSIVVAKSPNILGKITYSTFTVKW